MMEKTLILIKPDSIKKYYMSNIIFQLEENKYNIIGIKMLKLTKDEAESFYYKHRGKPFFKALIKLMISDKCVPMVLEGENVIKKVCKLMEEFNQKKNARNSNNEIEKNIEDEIVHCSTNPENAKFEVNFFFPELT